MVWCPEGPGYGVVEGLGYGVLVGPGYPPIYDTHEWEPKSLTTERSSVAWSRLVIDGHQGTLVR